MSYRSLERMNNYCVALDIAVSRFLPYFHTDQAAISTPLHYPLCMSVSGGTRESAPLALN